MALLNIKDVASPGDIWRRKSHMFHSYGLTPLEFLLGLFFACDLLASETYYALPSPPTTRDKTP